MSSTLIHTIPVSPLLTHHRNPVHSHLAIPIPGPITRVHAHSSPPQISHNEKCLAQLAPLASQHHKSEYNRMKFGPQGCPMAYTPLSIQCPTYIKDLQSNPLYIDRQSWYICPKSLSKTTKEHDPIVLGPSGSPTETVGLLQQELEAAMESPLSDNPQTRLEMPFFPNSSPQNSIKTSLTHPINVSTLLPIEFLPLISAHLTQARTPSSPVLFDLPLAYTLDRIALFCFIHTAGGFSPTRRTKKVDVIQTPRPLTKQALDYVSQPPLLPKSSTINLGNIFLSSCPGKKVRLSGPVKGRSAINRDLYTDLKRYYSLNIRLVICLLSDDELAFLGAPWAEYQSACAEIGLDILRLPIPEGLPPPSVNELDEILGRVITGWSIKGVNVLVHCRGGVGRAGLLGCCWALKLGLYGWIETGEYASPTPGVRRDTMRLIERMVRSIRSRRSVKAIETYEQVRFLMEYVEYLREGKGVGL